MTGLLEKGFNRIAGHERVLAYAIAIMVTLVAWAAIWLAGDRIKSLDEIAFVDLARTLAETGQYAKDGVPTAFRAPGLVFFLTPIAGLGFEIVALRLVNAGLIGLGLILVYHLLERRAGPLAGLLAVILIPAWPVVIYAGTTLYPQTLAATLLVLLTLFLDRIQSSRSLWPVIFGGIAYAALLYTIPIVLLLFPVLVIWIVWQARAKLLNVVVFTAVWMAIIAPWTYRNYQVFDEFIPVATSSGYNFLAGNAPNARFNTSLDVRFPEYVYTEITGKGEAEVNSIMTRAAIQEILNDRGRAAWLYMGKFLHWFDYSNSLLTDQVVEGGASSFAPNTRDMVLLVAWAMVILPLLLHLAFARRYPFTRTELLFLALWVCAGLAYALFFTRVRFRLPFDWLVISSNAIFLAAVIENWLAQRRPSPVERKRRA